MRSLCRAAAAANNAWGHRRKMPGDYCYPKDDHGLSSAELIQLKADCSTAVLRDPSSYRQRWEEKERYPRAATVQMAGGSPREEDGHK